jgi:hypothetical protein
MYIVYIVIIIYHRIGRWVNIYTDLKIIIFAGFCASVAGVRITNLIRRPTGPGLGSEKPSKFALIAKYHSMVMFSAIYLFETGLLFVGAKYTWS